ncbi:MAG: FliH/SctL family protein [Proteobacteria bacterium]|nr:FliH/SctL family protein [Pseudomonadota bacterium]
MAVAVAKKMFPDLNARNALGEVERVVVDTLKAITDEPRVQIRVSPGLREAFNERLPTLTHRAGFEGKVFVNADHALDIGDCAVEWSNGAAIRDIADAWQMIDEIVERNLRDADGEAAADADQSTPATESAPPTMSEPTLTADLQDIPAAEAAMPSAPVEAPIESLEAPAPTTEATQPDLVEIEEPILNQIDSEPIGDPPIPSSALIDAAEDDDQGDDDDASPDDLARRMGAAVSPSMAPAILDAQETDEDPTSGG